MRKRSGRPLGGCKTLGDYSDLYCRTDVLLLADVFETFQKMCPRQCGLDPAHYYTGPSLSWDALLKKTGMELELLTYYDQHLFIEKWTRGDISMVSKRHAKANNHLIDGYDSEKPSSHILYLHANNLCGWTMSQPLPTGALRWEEDCEQLAKTIADHPADDPRRLFTRGRPEVHRTPTQRAQCISAGTGAHGGAEKMDVRVSAQPPRRWGGSTEVVKLVPNLRNKDRYVLHYGHLQVYTSLGMGLTKVHRALRFDQSPLMEPYIWMNTELRKKAASDFEKDLYKLANTSVLGRPWKTCGSGLM